MNNEIRRRKALSRLRGQDADGWMPIEQARKDGTPYLLILKDQIETPTRPDLAQWNRLQFVGRHIGGDYGGWNFAAPVGIGGFCDKWIEGFRELPMPPRAQTEEREAKDG